MIRLPRDASKFKARRPYSHPRGYAAFSLNPLLPIRLDYGALLC